MSWTMREACEVLLAGRKGARRTGQDFKLDPMRMMHAGFNTSDVVRIEKAADEIELFTETTLAGLKRNL